MLLVIDSSAIAVAPEPTGGFALKISQIEGLPGIDVFIPVGKGQADEFIENVKDIMGTNSPDVEIFGPGDVPRGN